MSFWDFIDNYRSNAMKAATSDLVKPKTKADEYLTVPSPTENPTFNVPGTKKKGYQQVFGFEQDKANYGNERDGSSLSWRKLDVQNNDTGDSFQMFVGYDSDGKISGVRKFIDDKKTESYYGKELVGDFFKHNFDRDATDYTIFDEDDGGGFRWVLFDTKNDGSFVPSDAMGSLRNSVGVPRNSKNISEDVRDQRIRGGTQRKSLQVTPDDEKMSPAINGTMFDTEFSPHLKRLDDLDFFTKNANDFAGIIREFSRTKDYNSRMRILQEAYKKYGNNPQFGAYLSAMAADEEAHRNGLYDEYDYSRVGEDISNAINVVMDYYFHYS